MQYAFEKKKKKNDTVTGMACRPTRVQRYHLNSALVSVEHTCTNAHTT